MKKKKKQNHEWQEKMQNDQNEVIKSITIKGSG